MKTETAIVEIIIKGQQPNATLKELERSASALRAQLRRLPMDSKEFVDKTAELKKVNDRLAGIRNDIKGTGGMFQWLGKEVKAFGLVALAALGFSWFTSKIQNIIQGNAELSDSFADMRKTTGMTEQEVRKLNKTFSQMDTRTSTKELRQIAIAAGQLGIAKNEVLKFTAATDKMVVALGDEFTGGATEVTKVMGGLRDIFSDVKSDKIDEDMLHIGNAVNVLAQSGRATGPVLTDFANRIGGVAINLGLSSSQVLGLSATLQELNVSTERGGTAITKILLRMTTHVKEFAKVADMDVQAFADLVNTDLYGAFNKVLEGSQKSGTSATALGKILDDLGVDGSGASEVMSKLGANMGLLKDKVDLSNGALGKTDSIMEEFRIKNDTLGAEMDRLGKSFNTAFTNSTVSNALKSTIGFLADIFSNTKKVSESLSDERKELVMTEAEILTYNVGNKDRTKLIKEIQDKYPAYLGNIDAETVSHEALSAAIDKVNSSLVNKIVIQKQEEKIAEHAAIQADAAIKSGEARVKILQDMANIYAQNQKNIYKGAPINLKKDLAGLPMDVQAEEMLKFETYTGAGLSRYNNDIINLRANFAAWKEAELALNKEKMVGNELDAEKKKLLDALGISTENTAKAVVKARTAGTYVDEEAEKAAKKHAEEVLKIYQKLRADLQKLREVNSKSNLTEQERELAEEYDAYEIFRARIVNDEKMSEIEKNQSLEVLEENFQKNIKKINNKYQDLKIKERDEHDKKFLELTNNNRQIELNQALADYEKELEYFKDNEDKKLALKAAYDQKVTEINKKYSPGGGGELTQPKDKYDKERQAAQAFMRETEEFAQLYVQIESQKYSAASSAAEKKLEADILRNQRLYENDLISKQEFDKRVEDLNTEKQNKENVMRQKLYADQKRASQFGIILSGAEAIAGIWAKYAAAPYVAAALTAVSAGVTIAKLSLVEGTPAPTYAEGGLHDPNGYVSRETVFNSSSGTPFIAGERGAEWIAPNWMLQDPVIADNISMLESVRKSGRRFAGGGSTKTLSTESNDKRIQDEMVNTEVLKALTKLNEQLENGIEASLNYDRFMKTQNGINSAREASAIG